MPSWQSLTKKHSQHVENHLSSPAIHLVARRVETARSMIVKRKILRVDLEIFPHDAQTFKTCLHSVGDQHSPGLVGTVSSGTERCVRVVWEVACSMLREEVRISSRWPVFDASLHLRFSILLPCSQARVRMCTNTPSACV